MQKSDNDDLKLPLRELVRQIEIRATKTDRHFIAAAISLRELRQRIESGEAGVGVKWLEWARQNIGLESSRLYVLDAVGRAKDPHAELERQRKLERERRKKSRVAQATREKAMEPDRKELIAWAKTASIEDVRLSLRGIRFRENTGNIRPSGQSIETGRLH
jgi:hypothetical protein